ncbi:MAG: C45 family peptidase [Muribaculaceae bacterium]|nr:C45 family peptidase [Muribaculaceae bacterium]
MASLSHITLRLATLAATLLTALATLACTSALVGAEASATGRWMLWKHRDSGHPDNVVDRVEATDSTMAYVALFNAEDSGRLEAWIGFNSAGFAVMNTASYNLAPDTAKIKDREGFVMSRALAVCRTLEDFDSLLRSLPRPMGVQANFGVFDAAGNGAVFEAHDHGFTRHNLSESADGMILRTNFSFTGGSANRLGSERFDNECYIIDTITAKGKLAPWHFTETLSRSFRLPDGSDPFREGRLSMPDRGRCIARGSSCASVVIEGPLSAGEQGEGIVMWTAIGFPTLSSVLPATLDSVAEPLRATAANGRSLRCDRANALKAKVMNGKGRQRRFNLAAIRRMAGACRRDALAEYRKRHADAPAK